jgi:hypothetical protein
MSSDNPSGADNQQERLTTIGWLVGFVDGEGCFSVPIYRQRSMKLGWQVQPQFTVVQGESSRDVLEEMVRFFGCGKVYIKPPPRQPSRGFVLLPGVPSGRPEECDRSVLRAAPTQDGEARQLRQVRGGR